MEVSKRVAVVGGSLIILILFGIVIIFIVKSKEGEEKDSLSKVELAHNDTGTVLPTGQLENGEPQLPDAKESLPSAQQKAEYSVKSQVLSPSEESTVSQVSSTLGLTHGNNNTARPKTVMNQSKQGPTAGATANQNVTLDKGNSENQEGTTAATPPVSQGTSTVTQNTYTVTPGNSTVTPSGTTSAVSEEFSEESKVVTGGNVNTSTGAANTTSNTEPTKSTEDEKAPDTSTSSSDKAPPKIVELNPKTTKFLEDVKKPEYASFFPFLKTLKDVYQPEQMNETQLRQFDELKQRVLATPLESIAQPFHDAVKNRSADVLRAIYDIDVNRLGEDVHHLHMYEFNMRLDLILDAALDGSLTESHFNAALSGLSILADAVRLNKPRANYNMFTDKQSFMTLAVRHIASQLSNKMEAAKKAADEEGKDFMPMLDEFGKIRDLLIDVSCRFVPTSCPNIQSTVNLYIKPHFLPPHVRDANDRAMAYLQIVKMPEYSSRIPLLTTITRKLQFTDLNSDEVAKYKDMKMLTLYTPFKKRAQQFYDVVAGNSADVAREFYGTDLDPKATGAPTVQTTYIGEFQEVAESFVQAASDGNLSKKHFEDAYEGLSILVNALLLNDPGASTTYLFSDKSGFERRMLEELQRAYSLSKWQREISPTMKKERRDEIEAEFDQCVAHKDTLVTAFCEYAPHYCTTITTELNKTMNKADLNLPNL